MNIKEHFHWGKPLDIYIIETTRGSLATYTNSPSPTIKRHQLTIIPTVIQATVTIITPNFMGSPFTTEYHTPLHSPCTENSNNTDKSATNKVNQDHSGTYYNSPN